MVNTKKVLLNIFLVLIPLVAILSSIYLYTRSKKEVLGVGVKKESCIPYVSNVIPRVAYVGEIYYFVPRVVGCENDIIKIEVEGTEWLVVLDGYLITGSPLQSDIGTEKVTIIVKSSTGEYKVEDYIIVKEYEE